MVNKYVLSSDSFGGEAILHYDINGCLIFFDFKAEMNEEQLTWFFHNFPSTYHRLENMIFRSKTMHLKPIQADLSFGNFWDTYDYKVCNKGKAEKAWNALKEGEKVMVFDSLPAYNYFIGIKKIDKLYPTTFLNERRYEVNYRELIKKNR